MRENYFNTSVCRKPTITGQGIYTSINRAVKLSSSIIELTFHNNGYSFNYFNSIVKKFLNLQYRKESLVTTISKQTLYAQFSFIGTTSTQLRTEILGILGNFYPQISPMFCFLHNYTVGSYFKRHTASDMLVRSSVIYKNTCYCC